MLKFNTLLQEAGFDLEKVKVFLLRHEDKRAPIELYQAWKSVPEDFEAYQSNQKWKNRFPKGSYLAAFVVGPEGETLFVGMYEVLKLSRTNEPFIDPLLGPMEADDRSFHEIKRSDKMQDYVEKLVIEWGPGKLAWRQHAKEQNKTILEVRPRLKEPPFPVTLISCVASKTSRTFGVRGNRGSKKVRACTSWLLRMACNMSGLPLANLVSGSAGTIICATATAATNF